MTTNIVTEKSIRLLIKYVKLLKGDISNNILKSYYMSRCNKLCHKENYSIPKAIFGKGCSKCYTAYSDCSPSYRLLKHKKRNRFIRRLNKRIQDNIQLTPFQTKIRESFQKNKESANSNTLLIICNVCHKKEKIVLEKPINHKLPKCAHQIDQKKKKRKRKDHLAGLNVNYVLSNKKPKRPSVSFKPVENNSKKALKRKLSLLTKKVKNNIGTPVNGPSYSLGDFLNSLSK